MKVDKKGHTTILRDTKKDIISFISAISTQYPTYKNQNLILDISLDKNINSNDVLNFKDLAKQHTKAKKSFVIVTDTIEFDQFPAYLTVVPSVLEAHDIIEMEEIERDLGF
jgi:hypothetical protein